MTYIPKLYFDGNIPNYIIPLIQDYKYEISSYNDCDFIISCKFYEETTNSVKKIQTNLSSYSNVYKKVIVFLICDFADNFIVPLNVILYRTSLLKSRMKVNEFILPYVWENFMYKTFKPLDKNIGHFPIVGFCGRVDKYREKLIKQIQDDKFIQNNFILKTEFWGGDPHNPTLIEDFINNIENSHFTICNRGNGNYAMRLYQTLSLGRIPVLIDTDLKFPFEDVIDWNEIAIIGKNEIDVINKIKYWWCTYDISAIQQDCKNTFIKFFNPLTFLSNVMDELSKKLIYPIDFDLIIYKKYSDLQHLNPSELINHYIHFGKKENRIYKLPENFNHNNYRLLNSDLSNLNYDQLIEHYINFGHIENRKFME